MPFDHKSFLKTLTNQPGVYQMFDEHQKLLYVGKARHLKNRVSSYFQRTNSLRLQRLVSQIANIELLITKTENEALLLENNLIKKLKPRYNILFRDDKSYPYIFLSAHKDYPRMDFHRGAKVQKGQYYGPYPSSGAVRETLNLLQKLFRIRQCRDTFFRHRARPCIQYQIKRCTAPCVEYISPEDYQHNIHLAELFLAGKNKQLILQLMKKMEAASKDLEYEEAAYIRDQITALRKVQEQQYVMAEGGDVDVISAQAEADSICVHVLFIRAGRIIGNHNFFTRAPLNREAAEILAEFIPQFYLNPNHKRDIPKLILVSETLAETRWFETALTEAKGSKLTISHPRRGKRKRWLQMAEANAKMALTSHLSTKASFNRRLLELQKALKLANIPQRIECFDISHSMGEATVGSCVVFNQEGADKGSYRRFNIKNVKKGDDYGAMREVLRRRYGRLKTEGKVLPDVILIDGGKGQLHQAEIVLEELQITGVQLFSIAKGLGRKPGLETIYQSGSTTPIKLPEDSLGLHILQQIRDEAHRFAITGHKLRREKGRKTSSLEGIAGVGVKRRRQLLNYFGGMQGVKSASVEQLADVPGISRPIAEKIFAALH